MLKASEGIHAEEDNTKDLKLEYLSKHTLTKSDQKRSLILPGCDDRQWNSENLREEQLSELNLKAI